MTHYLLYKSDASEPQKIRKLSFTSLDDALAEACRLFKQNQGHDFEIQDEQGDAVMSESEIAEACKEAAKK